jgi:thiosulfate dehydrogenase [quinone] large subunit
MRANDKPLAFALLRVAIGFNFAGHGFIRLFKVGLSQFANSAANNLSKSPLPHGLTIGFLHIVPVLEAVIGVLLILGLFTRCALIAGSVLMIFLTIGVTSNQQWDAAGTQLLYSLVLFVLLFCVEYNEFSMDRWMRR